MNAIPFDRTKRDVQAIIDDPELEDIVIIYTKKDDSNLHFYHSGLPASSLVFWHEQAKMEVLSLANG